MDCSQRALPGQNSSDSLLRKILRYGKKAIIFRTISSKTEECEDARSYLYLK